MACQCIQQSQSYILQSTQLNTINVQSTEPTRGLLATTLCTETRSVSNKPSLIRRYTPEPTSYCLQRVNPDTMLLKIQGVFLSQTR
uniref:Uncharacterized protein n=1 Tax=Setaria italica TaxID=4555 RepID=K3YX82_SETIT